MPKVVADQTKTACKASADVAAPWSSSRTRGGGQGGVKKQTGSRGGTGWRKKNGEAMAQARPEKPLGGICLLSAALLPFGLGVVGWASQSARCPPLSLAQLWCRSARSRQEASGAVRMSVCLHCPSSMEHIVERTNYIVPLAFHHNRHRTTAARSSRPLRCPTGGWQVCRPQKEENEGDAARGRRKDGPEATRHLAPFSSHRLPCLVQVLAVLSKSGHDGLVGLERGWGSLPADLAKLAKLPDLHPH